MDADRLDKLLANSAHKSPAGIAVIHPQTGSVTYAQLDAFAGQISEALQAVGVASNDRVGICLPKSIGSVASIFASLRSEACHVPVDPGAPAQRCAYIFADCGVKAILAHRPLLGELLTELAAQGATVAECIDVPTRDYAGVDLVLVHVVHEQTQSLESDDKLAYILYTSGSTGKPKGVIHSHSTALAFVDWCSEEFKPTCDDRFSSHAPFHFDLSIFDLYVSIKHQSTLVLIGEEEGKKPLGLAAIIAEQKISVWYSTPSILRLLVEYGELENLDCSSLRLILYAGEVFPVKHLRALYAKLPMARYYNLYGPTETNVCTFRPLTIPIPDDDALPGRIGAVCSGDNARVVDETGGDVPPGTEGELWIAGDSVHLGYWNLPQKNAEVFVTDAAANRWYKTGDLVIDTGEGDYLFLGRRDRMVKRRGFRVELGEIESILYGHPDISEAAVVALPDEDSGVQLRAFIQWSGDGKPSILKLKRFASENLLSYMNPDRFVFLDTLPKTSTDKVDYQRLKDM